MKIVCDSCGTKYSIADDKVRGKVFKIRCKKCAHIIIVRGNEDQPTASPATAELDALQTESPSSQGSFDQKETRVFDYSGFDGAEAPAAQQGYGAEPVWHCVIEREQVGPMTEDELRERLRTGEIDGETYVWREGFGDWARLATVGELAHVMADQQHTVAEGTERRAAPEAPSRNGSSGLHYGSVSSSRSAPDLFATDGGRGGEAPQPLFTAPAGSEDDLFGMPGRTGSAPHDEPAPDPAPAPRARRAPAPEPEPSGMGGGLEAAGEQRMTGQRNENSVLFSLNNLSALAQAPAGPAAGAPKPSPTQNGGTTEGSGLIDIRAMAATTLGIDQRRAQASSGAGGALPRPPTDEELPPIGFSPVAASPLLMPSAPKPTVPPWVWAVVGGAFLLLAGAVVLAFKVFSTPSPGTPPPPVVAAPTAPAAPIAAAPTAAAPAAAAPAAAAPAAPAKEEHVASAKENRDSKGKDKGKDKGEKVAKADKADKGDKPAAAAALPPTSADPPAPKEPAEKPAKKGKKGDDLDDLLNGATGGKKQHAAKSTATEPDEAPKKKEPAADPNLPSQLSQAQVMSGIKRVKGTVQGCFDKYKEQGLVQVKITIAPSGSVTSSTVTGKFAGTQTGDCVGTAVKSAKFDKFNGSPMAITYPFMLR